MSISITTIQPFWSDRLAELYRLACLGQLTSGLLHDLGNPVQLVTLNLEQLRNELPLRGKASQMLERAMLGTERVQLFLEAGRRYVQQQSIQVNFPVLSEITQALLVFQSKARAAEVEIEVNCSDQVRLYGDPLKFYQIISNLLSNALDSYLEEENLSPRQIQISVSEDTEQIQLLVQDWGRGVSSADLTHIFEPFFTTKRAGKGLGIGLAITKEIIEKEFAAAITVESQQGKGTLFTVTFPVPTRQETNGPRPLRENSQPT